MLSGTGIPKDASAASGVVGNNSNKDLKRKAPTTVLLCRHGETDWNLEKRFQGLIDITLNESGQEQARQMASSLKDKEIVAVWTSPLRRARYTGAKIATAVGVDLSIDKRLIERDLGKMSGLTSEVVRQRYPEFWKAWKTTGIAFPPEAMVELGPVAVARLESAIFDLSDLYPGKTVVVVAHGALIRVLLHRAVGTASITSLVVGPGRSWQVDRFNDDSHLGGLRGPDADADLWGGIKAMTTVVVCRHGETNWNLARKFQGMEDIPLNTTGCEQALLLAEAVKLEQISAVWALPLLRARETGVAIAAASGLKLKLDTRLRERNLGVFQGRDPSMMDKEFPESIAAWRAQVPLPEESKAEPAEEVVERVELALFDLAAAYPGKKVALVLHGATIRCLLKRAVGSLRIETPKNVSLTTVVVGPGKNWHLARVADSSHMPLLPEEKKAVAENEQQKQQRLDEFLRLSSKL